MRPLMDDAVNSPLSPGMASSPLSASASLSAAAAAAGSTPMALRPNKGLVLSKSVEYIRYLQQIIEVQAQRNRDLERALQDAGGVGLDHSVGDPAGGPRSAAMPIQSSQHHLYADHQHHASVTTTEDFLAALSASVSRDDSYESDGDAGGEADVEDVDRMED